MLPHTGHLSSTSPYASASGSGFGAASNSPTAGGDDAELVSPANLRKLVLNYLVHHCYTSTANAFARDGIADTLTGAAPSSSSLSATRSKPSNGVSNGSSSNGATGSSRTAAASVRQAHPLSAPPLSREDSSMEIEVESLLTSTNNGAPPLASTARADDEDEEKEKAAAEDQVGGQVAVTVTGTNGHSNGTSAASNGKTHADSASSFEATGDLTADELEAVQIRKGELVLGFIRSSCHTDTVSAEIRDHIIQGRIRLAIDMCNAHFPAVLNADTAASSSARPHKAKVHLTPGGEPSGSGTCSPLGACSPSLAASSNRVLPANPTSLDPAHLLLNLQIQVFIESIRSASQAGAGAGQMTGSGHLPPLATNTPGIAAAASISRAASPAPSSASSNGSGTSTTGGGTTSTLNPALHSALAYAQGLYTSAQKLPSYWRAMYLKELEQVTALLAYTDVEHSPVRKFLHRSRKVALAEQVNSAILCKLSFGMSMCGRYGTLMRCCCCCCTADRTGKPSQPLIESAVRQTAFVCSTLHNEKVPIPPSHPILSVSGAPAGSLEEATSKKNGNGKVRALKLLSLCLT